MTKEEIRAEFYALAAKLRAAGHRNHAARAELLGWWFTDKAFEKALCQYVHDELTTRGDWK